jgi:acetaldehyde dehydrogenase/alcohol dehydrogenase
LGNKSYFVAIPTTSGTGSEVTPFSVISDEKTGIKHPLADYELMPNMAIIDSSLSANAPKELIVASGIDALTHAIESYVSIFASDYTDALAIGAIKIIFEFLPRLYKNGSRDKVACEKMANASTMAGIAFANVFLGVCHSMAHKLSSYYHFPHGIANALLIEHVIKYNAENAPFKMGTFSQYSYPMAREKYAKIAVELYLEGDDKVRALLNGISQLKNELGIKGSIKDYGIDEKDFLEKLDKMSLEAFDDQCTGANPRYPLIEEIKDIYISAYYGKVDK